MTDRQDSPEPKESVDYDLVRKGMDAAEQAARESRVGRGLKPKVWAIVLILAAVLITRFVSQLTG